MILVDEAGVRRRNVSALRRSRPHDAVILCTTKHVDWRIQQQGAHAGVDTTATLDGRPRPSLTRIVRGYLRHWVPPEHWPLDATADAGLTECLRRWIVRNAWRPLRCSDVATWFGLDHGTLNRHLRRARHQRLHAQIVRARLMHLELLRTHQALRPVELAEDLGFSSVAALRMFWRRCVRVVPCDDV